MESFDFANWPFRVSSNALHLIAHENLMKITIEYCTL
jgi:hypothetical protein